MIRKAMLQNCMALDILTAFQGSTCAIIQTESYVFIPDEFSSITHLMNHMKSQISALSDPFPSPDDLLKKKKKNWFAVGGSWLNYLLLIPLMLLTSPFAFCLFHKIIISCITRCMMEPPMKMMIRLGAADQMYSSIYDQ